MTTQKQIGVGLRSQITLYQIEIAAIEDDLAMSTTQEILDQLGDSELGSELRELIGRIAEKMAGGCHGH